MGQIVDHLVTFLVGFAYDAVGIFYARQFLGRRPWESAYLSMWLGGASVLGLGAALGSRADTVALVLGYGAGTWVATRYF